MSQDKSVDYEILSVEAVQQLHRRFMENVDKRVDEAVSAARAQGNREGRLPALLKAFLLGSARRRMDINAKNLKAAAAGGCVPLVLGIEKLPDLSPFSFRQEWTLNKAAEKRQDIKSVQDVFGAEHRIYLRYRTAGIVSDTQERVKNELMQKNYEIVDYKEGIATDGKQKFKIGKLLKDDPMLLEAFRDDSTRTGDNVLAVISRDPDDIARMSTNRRWKNCMSHNGDYFNKYAPSDIQDGTLVAYMISESDPEINDPLGRILIKPYERIGVESEKPGMVSRLKAIFKEDSSRQPKKDEDVVYMCESKMYGVSSASFQSAVEKFVNDVLNRNKEGFFYISSKLRADSVAYGISREGGVTKGAFHCDPDLF